MNSSLWQKLPEDVENQSARSRNRRNILKNAILFVACVWSHLAQYLGIFLRVSSIHGLSHLVANKRHPFEKVLWLVAVGLSIAGTVFLSRTTWLRYQSSPTVVSMDRDMYSWNTTFPCVTVCPTDKVDNSKLDLFLQYTNLPDKDKLRDFIKSLASAGYRDFKYLPMYDGIDGEDYMELIVNVSVAFDPTLTIGASGISFHLQPTITEMGLCYSVNSKAAAYNSPRYRKENRWDVTESPNDTFFVHPLDGEVFAQLINLSTGYNVYVHGPEEVPEVSTKFLHSEDGFYMRLYVTALSIYTTQEASKLKVAQRKCRFARENDLKHNSIYSYNLCRMECRINLCLEYCNCIPHFYRKIDNEEVCDVEGLKCLAKYERYMRGGFLSKNCGIECILYSLSPTASNSRCDCLPLCDDVNYVIQSSVIQQWFLGTNFQWGIVTYPRMRFRRDIIFGLTDVLVAVGSMAGLFLGCTVLSFMEIIYFLTIRLFWYLMSY